jgi:hypothetical protein
MISVVSGVPSSAYAAVEGAEAEASHEAGLPHEEADHDGDACGDDGCGCQGPCSPVCNACTCALGGRSVPAPPVLMTAPFVVVTLERPLAVVATAPPAPDRASVFHPPRA